MDPINNLPKNKTIYQRIKQFTEGLFTKGLFTKGLFTKGLFTKGKNLVSTLRVGCLGGRGFASFHKLP